MAKPTSDGLQESYDELPYDSKPFNAMHPDRLASVGIAAGLETVPVDRCRVLELGCAAGGNLIPMAEALPQSTFVGVDLSSRQISEGLANVARLGMSNLQLRTMNLLEIGPAFGQFDYIICHGVYSWVPPEVQAKILDICRENLSPRGLACISCNIYPGWHERMMAREMMLYRVDRSAPAREQVRQARELMRELHQTLTAARVSPASHELSLRDELKMLEETGDHYVFHEHLEAYNEPVYFEEFVRRVRAQRLEYVNRATPDLKAARLMEMVDALSIDDPIRREQYLDFMTGNSFRLSVLCHAGRAVNYHGDPDALRRLVIMGLVNLKTPGNLPDLTSAAPVTFVAAQSTEITVGDLNLKAALTILAQSLRNALPFDELAREVQRQVRQSDQPMPLDEARRMGESLLQCYQAGVVQLITHLVSWESAVRDRPQVTPFARLQAATGESSVTNRRHLPIDLPPFEMSVVALLDGTRDRAAIVEAMAADAAASAAALSQQAPSREAIAERVEKTLRRIAHSALLIG